MSDVAARAVGIFAAIIAARYLGAASYGELSVGIAVGSIAAYGADLGTAQTLIREGSRPDADMPLLLASATKLRGILAGASSLLCAIAIAFLYHGHLGLVVAFVALPMIWGRALQGAVGAYYLATEQMKAKAVLESATTIVLGLSLITAAILHLPVTWAAAAYGTGSLLAGLAATIHVRRSVPWCVGWDPRIADELVVFTAGGILLMILPQVGPLVLQRVGTLADVGTFAAASRIPSALYQVPGVVAAAFYPRLFAVAARDTAAHRALVSRELTYMTALGLTFALPFANHASWVMHLLLGAEWNGAAETLQILIWVMFANCLNYPLADALTTAGLQRRRTAILAIGGTLLIASTVFLGTRYGLLGVARGALIAHVVMAAGYLLSGGEAIRENLRVMRRLGGVGIVASAFAFAIKATLGSSTLTFLLTLATVAFICVLLIPLCRDRAAAVASRGFRVAASWAS